MNLRQIKAYKFCKRWGLSITFAIFLILQLLILNETRHSNDKVEEGVRAQCVQLVEAREEVRDVVVLILSSIDDEFLIEEVNHKMDLIFPELECD